MSLPFCREHQAEKREKEQRERARAAQEGGMKCDVIQFGRS